MNEQKPAVAIDIIAPSALESISRADIDMQISTAKRYPRDIATIKNKIEQLATLDEETAEQCFYSMERDGKVIEGPSVRLAEIAMTCYQNIKAGYRPMSNDGKKVIAQGMCYDLENNVAISVEKSRKITKRDGSPFSEDMQIVTMNAAGAIAFRDAVFKVVPQVLVKPAMEKAKQVALGNAESLSKRRVAIMSKLMHFCPNEKRILDVVKKQKVDQLEPTDLLKLMGLATALKDGELSVEEAFPKEQIAMPQSTADVKQTAQTTTAKPKAEKKTVSAPAEQQKAEAQAPAQTAPVAFVRADCIKEVAQLIDKSRASKVAKIMSAVGVTTWENGGNWADESTDDQLKSLASMLKC